MIDNEFNWKIYVNNYSDLRAAEINTSNAAYNHWRTYGKKEGRIANVSIDGNFFFDWKYYVSMYDDLQNANITTEQKANIHWELNGQKEQRIPNYNLGNHLIPKNNSKKVLLFFNHGTIVNALSQLFKTFEGVDFYFPFLCGRGSEHIIDGNEIRSLRTLNDTFLDKFNLYKDFEINYKLSTIIKHINENYDVFVFIPQVFTPFIINKLLSEIKTKILLYYWGGMGNKSLLQYYPNIISFLDQPNLKIIFPLKQMLSFHHTKKSSICNLVLDQKIKPYENAWRISNNYKKKGMVFSSRIHLLPIHLPEKLIKIHGANLCFHGNNLLSTVKSFPYNHEFNIISEKYYETFLEHDYFVYLLREMDMIQYSPLEAIYIGQPVFYFSDTLLARLINDKNWFECDTLDEMGEKIIKFDTMDQHIINSNCIIQKNALKYYSFSDARVQWLNIINE